MSPAADHRPWRHLPTRTGRCVALVLIALAATRPAYAQPPADSPDDALEAYLARHGLNELLAAHLLERVRATAPGQRAPLAERLAQVYVELLSSAATPEARALWEQRGETLLQLVPEAQSAELRLDLAKVRYLQAEAIAERWRLRLAQPDELEEARRVLRAVAPVFRDVGTQLHRQVELLETQEERAGDVDLDQLRRELAAAQRLRSLAMYYAGWAEYYTAMLTGVVSHANQALVHFGWLLNAAGGREPSLERLPMEMLRYEHVARAAVGAALCFSLRGSDDTAVRWLDAIDAAPSLAPAVRAQLPARRLVIYARARRWADLELFLRRAVRNDGQHPDLDTGQARLLAVLALDALESGAVHGAATTLVRSLAEAAIAELIARGELAHVLDLVRRYGTAPIGKEGFIALYVRGLRAYDAAREAHTATGVDPSQPVDQPAIVNRYREAADALGHALDAADAARFAAERTEAAITRGLALYYAGLARQASEQLESASAAADRPDQAERALWLAIVALDAAVESQPSLRPRLERLATLYLRQFGRTERAARLLLRRLALNDISPAEAADILLAVSPESDLYEPSRRQAARLLYMSYRSSPAGRERDFAASRFLELAQQILTTDQRRLAGAGSTEAHDIAADLLTLIRQVLDVSLGLSVPDVARAQAALDTLDRLDQLVALDTGSIAAELAFRRLQLALAHRQFDRVEQWLAVLSQRDDRYAAAADQLLLTFWTGSLEQSADDTQAARAVVRHGQRILARRGFAAPGIDATQPHVDPDTAAIADAVAHAAAAVWRTDHDAIVRDLAIRLDRALLEAGYTSERVLRRYAELTEAAEARADALDAWRALLAGFEVGSDGWYEARYHSLRLLAQLDPVRARVVMDQHKVLMPDFGPEPWGPRLRALDARIPAEPPGPPPDLPDPGTDGP